MPTCACGEEMKTLNNPAHLNGAPHRCNMTRVEVEKRGLTDCAPLSFTRGVMQSVFTRLDVENVVGTYREYRKGGPRKAHTENTCYNTTERLAVAVLRYGGYDATTRWLGNSSGQGASFNARSLKATLLMQSLYGDDATEVFWRFALSPADDETNVVRSVLAANGIAFTTGEWAEFAGSYCLEALLLAESARLKQIDEGLAVAA